VTYKNEAMTAKDYAEIAPLLEDGEYIIWADRPKGLRPNPFMFAILFLLSLVMIGSFLDSSEPFPVVTYVILTAIGVSLFFAPLKEVYALTDRRLIIKGPWWGMGTEIISLDSISRIDQGGWFLGKDSLFLQLRFEMFKYRPRAIGIDGWFKGFVLTGIHDAPAIKALIHERLLENARESEARNKERKAEALQRAKKSQWWIGR